MPFKVTTSSAPSVWPYIVERLNTENWNTDAGALTLEAAFDRCRELRATYPSLGLRVVHHPNRPAKEI